MRLNKAGNLHHQRAILRGHSSKRMKLSKQIIFSGLWMPRLDPIPGVPRGLEYLTFLDKLVVQHKSPMLQVGVGREYEYNDKYSIVNNLGQMCYVAFEESRFLFLHCCGPNRAFTIHMTGRTRQSLFEIKRPFKCLAGCDVIACCPCAQDELEVVAADNTPLGYVKQACSTLRPRYVVYDHNKKRQFEILGRRCQWTMCNQNIDFLVKPYGSNKVIATITKHWTGVVREYFADTDNFGISFPLDLDVKLKATLLGCVFLIDFMYFEDRH